MRRQNFIPVFHMACRLPMRIRSMPTCSRSSKVRWPQQPEQDSPQKLKRDWAMQNNDPKLETTEFKGRRILVTGGTRGIGEAIVNRLVRGGGDVIATARSVSPETSADRFVQADVSTRDGIESVAKAVTDRLKGLDILIHNVGGSAA